MQAPVPLRHETHVVQDRVTEEGERSLRQGCLRQLAALWQLFPEDLDYRPVWQEFLAVSAPLWPRLSAEVSQLLSASCEQAMMPAMLCPTVCSAHCSCENVQMPAWKLHVHWLVITSNGSSLHALSCCMLQQ